MEQDHDVRFHPARINTRQAILDHLKTQILTAQDLAHLTNTHLEIIREELLTLYLTGNVQKAAVYRHKDVPKHWGPDWYRNWVIYWEPTLHAREHSDHLEMFHCPGCRLRRWSGHSIRP